MFTNTSKKITKEFASSNTAGSLASWPPSSFGGNLPDAFMDLGCFILDSGSDAHQSSASLVPLSVQSQGAGPWLETSMHCVELPCLDLSGLCLLIIILSEG